MFMNHDHDNYNDNDDDDVDGDNEADLPVSGLVRPVSFHPDDHQGDGKNEVSI